MSVLDKIRAGDYDSKVPYHVDTVPVDEEKMTVRQAREHSESEKERQ